MENHSWEESGYTPQGRHFFLNYDSPLCHYKCRTCKEELTLPDCGKLTCLALLSFGCTGKPSWKNPITPKRVELSPRTYPAKRGKSK